MKSFCIMIAAQAQHYAAWPLGTADKQYPDILYYYCA